MVVAHAALCFHCDEDNSEILVLYEGLGATPRCLLPGRRVLKLLDFLLYVRSDHRICKLRKSGQVLTILGGVANFFVFGHVGVSSAIGDYRPHGSPTRFHNSIRTGLQFG